MMTKHLIIHVGLKTIEAGSGHCCGTFDSTCCCKTKDGKTLQFISGNEEDLKAHGKCDSYSGCGSWYGWRC